MSSIDGIDGDQEGLAHFHLERHAPGAVRSDQNHKVGSSPPTKVEKVEKMKCTFLLILDHSCFNILTLKFLKNKVLIDTFYTC